MNLRQLDKKYFGRKGKPEDVVVGSSAESWLIDARGRKYIDFMMGWCVGNLGWGTSEIREAAQKFDGPDYVHPDFLYRPLVQLAEMLAKMTPGSLNRRTVTLRECDIIAAQLTRRIGLPHLPAGESHSSGRGLGSARFHQSPKRNVRPA